MVWWRIVVASNVWLMGRLLLWIDWSLHYWARIKGNSNSLFLDFLSLVLLLFFISHIVQSFPNTTAQVLWSCHACKDSLAKVKVILSICLVERKSGTFLQSRRRAWLHGRNSNDATDVRMINIGLESVLDEPLHSWEYFRVFPVLSVLPDHLETDGKRMQITNRACTTTMTTTMTTSRCPEFQVFLCRRCP